mmetsp:Transcript_24499/g.79153  ORF Transcript_24499/g.79153 Transcript_24499/m.79153 type:complete len:249 (-) Transcript_24499:1309-2055(-)
MSSSQINLIKIKPLPIVLRKSHFLSLRGGKVAQPLPQCAFRSRGRHAPAAHHVDKCPHVVHEPLNLVQHLNHVETPCRTPQPHASAQKLVQVNGAVVVFVEQYEQAQDVRELNVQGIEVCQHAMVLECLLELADGDNTCLVFVHFHPNIMDLCGIPFLGLHLQIDHSLAVCACDVHCCLNEDACNDIQDRKINDSYIGQEQGKVEPRECLHQDSKVMPRYPIRHGLKGSQKSTVDGPEGCQQLVELLI